MNCRNSSTPSTRRTWGWLKTGLLGAALALFGSAQAQVTVTGATVGNGPYGTLGAAFTAINAGAQTGTDNIVVGISASTTEAGPCVLNTNTWATLKIYPTVTGLTISAATTTGRGVIELNGADNVTIDGALNGAGSVRDLTITNTAASTITYTSVIRLATLAGNITADGNTIRNCNLNGSATGRNAAANTSTTGSENTTFGIYAGGNGAVPPTAPSAISSVTSNTAPSGTTVNNLTCTNNAVNACARGIVFNGANASVSTGTLSITNNTIGGAGALGSYPFTSPTTTVYIKGIYISGCNTLTITGNTLNNILSYVSTAMSGIELNSAITGVTTTINNNTISGVALNGTGANTANGIIFSAHSGGTYSVSGNTISNIQNNGSASNAGIFISSSSATSGMIQNNRISTVYARSTGGYAARGIYVNSGSAVTMQNNMIWDINMCPNNSGTTATFGARGIYIGSASGTGHKVYHNTVSLAGPVLTSTNADITACFAIETTANSGCDVRNNIFSNTMTGGSALSNHMCVYLPSGGTSAMNLIMNNNALYQGGAANSWIMATQPTLATYTAANFNAAAITPATNMRAYTSTLSAAGTNDNASYASAGAAPLVSTTNLHVTGTPAELNNAGASVGLASDIDGDFRTTPPDIGADEFTPAACGAPVATAATQQNCVSSNYYINVTLTSLSGAPSVDIGSNYSGNPGAQIGVTTPGTYQIGPFPSNTTVTVSVLHNGNHTCDASLGSFNYNCANFGQNALSFDGVNDRVDCGTGASVNITGTAITLEAWIFPTAFQASSFQGSIINKEGSANQGYMLRCGGTGQLSFAFGTGAAFPEVLSATNALTLNTWQHVAATYDGVTMRIFRDGVQLQTLAQTTSIATSPSQLTIGDYAVTPGARVFIGKIDEVRIWNIAIDQATLAANMSAQSCGSPAGLQAYYRFNQGVENANNAGVTSLPDLSGNANNGTLFNFALNGTTSNWVPGKTGLTGCASCNAAPTAGSITGTTPVCSAATPGSLTLTGATSGVGISYQWSYGPAGNPGLNPLGTSLSQSTATIPVGTWEVQVAVTCSGFGTTNTAAFPFVKNQTPTATAGSNSPVCAGQPLNLTGTTATGTSFTWSGPLSYASTSQSPQVSATAATGMAGTYIFTATLNGCTSAPSNTVVVINPSPTAITVTPPAPTICAGSSVVLTASGGQVASTVVSGAGGSISGVSTALPNPMQNWYGGTKQQTMWRASELTALGLVNGSKITSIAYRLAATSGVACQNFRIKAQLSSTITDLTTTPVSTGWVTKFGPQSIIPVVEYNTFTLTSPIIWDGTSNLLLEVNYSNANSGGGSTNSAYYDLGLPYNATFQFQIDSKTAAELDGYPLPTGTSTQALHAGRNQIKLGITIASAFTWNASPDLNTTSGPVVTATPPATNTYTVSSTGGGCTTSQTVTVTIGSGAPPTVSISAGGPTTFCAGGSVLLSSNVLNGCPAFTYSWSNGVSVVGTNPTYSATASGNYTVTVTDIGSQMASSNTIAVTVNPIPTATAGSNSPVCAGTALNLTGTSNGATFSWTGPASYTSTSQSPQVSASATAAMAGTYAFTATLNGCSSPVSNTIVVVNPSPVISSTTATPGTICPGGSSQLNVVATTGTAFMSVVPITYAPIAGSGTAISAWAAGGDATNDDGFSAPITLPFTFTLNGTGYTQVWVSPNGYLTFLDPVGVSALNARTSSNMTSNTTPNGVVALTFADMIASSGTVSTFSTGGPGNQVFVLDYTNVPFYNGTGSVTGQIQLYQNGNKIEVHAGTINHGTNVSVNALGVENGAGSDRVFPPGRDPVTLWNVAVSEAWRFAPAANTYSWSPGTFLSSTTISNPMANAVTATTPYTVSVTNSLNCSAQGTATVTVPTVDDGNPCTLDVCTGNGVVTHTFQDADGDGICDANDPCPNLAYLQNGDPCNDGNACTTGDVVSGCVCAGTPSGDTDGDGVCDAQDNCPTVPGQQGSACDDSNPCTTGDVLNASCVCVGTPVTTDTDGDGTPDCSDNCPNLAGQQGDACNDGNVCTINDVITAGCVCAGTFQDTDGDGICNANDNCPNLAGQQGDACNDGDPNTTGDVITAGCVCAGQAIDCLGVPNGTDLPGTPCNDANVCTINDTWNTSCVCVGTFQDTDGDGICNANDNCPNLAGQQGDACNDGNVCTINDVITAGCVCAGTFQDTDGDGICNANDNCPNLAGVQGDACNDGNVCTINDVITAGCVCAGTFQDTDGDGICNANDNCPNLAGQQGDACNDGNVCTINDVITAGCVCAGTPDNTDTDLDGVPDCSDNCPTVPGQQGSPCDDGDVNTTGDVLGANCECHGTTCTLNGTHLTFNTDADGGQISWSIVDQTTSITVCQGSGLPSNSTITVDCCLADGCYDLIVTDMFGDGIHPGGFVLRDGTGQRIIDNVANGQTFSSVSQSPQGFCLPLSAEGLVPASCDIENATLSTVLHAQPNAVVTAFWTPSNISQQGYYGYQYWVTNPHGGFSRRITLTLGAPGAGAPAGTPANMKPTYFLLSSMNFSAPFIPRDILLNVRVRAYINGVYGSFGPACRLMLPYPPCATTQLTTTATPVVSCGATGLTLSSTVYADNVASATNYQFEFSKPGYNRRITQTVRSSALNFVTSPLQNNNCYQVRVRISFDGAQTYCPFGPYCTITIGSAVCAPPSMALETGDVVADQLDETRLAMWPNPSDGSQVQLSLMGFSPELSTVGMDVTDVYGQLVATRTIPVQDGQLITTIDFDNALAPGLYLVNLQVGEERFTQRLMIQR